MRIVGGKITAWPGQPLRTISMTHDGPPADSISPYTVTVWNYQNSGTAFQVYFPVQTTTSQHYGGLAPCGDTVTHPEIAGVTCGTAATPPPVSRRTEICGNGLDDDGDGLIDEDCSSPSPSQPPTCAVDWARLVRIEVGFGGVIVVVFNNPAGCGR